MVEVQPSNISFTDARSTFIDLARETCPEMLGVYDERFWSPFPFALAPSQYWQLRRVSRAVRQAMHAVVDNYFTDEAIRSLMPLDDRISSILKTVRDERVESYKIGAWRPDFLFREEDGRPMLCEINARFAFNGYFVSHQGCELLQQLPYLATMPATKFSHMAEVEERFANAFMDRLRATSWGDWSSGSDAEEDCHDDEDEDRREFASCRADKKRQKPVLGILLGREAGWDVHLFASRMRARGVFDVIFVKPNDLALVERSHHQFPLLVNSVTGTELTLLALELHQDELIALSDDILLAVARRAVLNDLWTIFLLHDKRLFAVMSSMPIMAKYITCPRTLKVLEEHIIPTRLLRDVREELLSGDDPARWLIKPHLLGKGKGFLIGSKFHTGGGGSRAWKEAVAAAPGEWIVQPILKQQVFNITTAPSSSSSEIAAASSTSSCPMYVVGLLLCFNDHLIAPGIFRASAVENLIVNVSGGNSCILLPVLLTTPWVKKPQTHEVCGIEEAFLSAFPDRVCCHRRETERIQQALERDGVALIRHFLADGEKVRQPVQQEEEEHAEPSHGGAAVEQPSCRPCPTVPLDDVAVNTELHHYLETFGIMNFHDAGQTVVWDVRPNFKSPARSHNDKEFPMHTDCAFENPPPRFIALYVVRQDQQGGGISRFVPADFLVRYLLSSETLRVLRMTEFTFRVPEEFRKEAGLDTCMGPIVSAHGHWRYRGEIIVREKLTQEQVAALKELDGLLCNPHYAMTTRLPQDSLVILDNTRWFHGRSKIKDSERWLKRVRFHSLTPVADLTDFTRMESLTFFTRETSTATSIGSPLVLAPPGDEHASLFSSRERQQQQQQQHADIPKKYVADHSQHHHHHLRRMLLHAADIYETCGGPRVRSIVGIELAGLSATHLLSLFPVVTKSQLFERVDAIFARMKADLKRKKKMQESSSNSAAADDDDDASIDEEVYRGLYWSPSGGTVGAPRYFPTNVHENVRQRQLLAPLFSDVGALTKETICVNLFASNKMYRAQEILSDFIVMNGGTTLPIGAAASDEEIVAFAREFRANTICGMPPRLVQLASYMKAHKIQLPSVRRILFGGEPLYEPKVVLLREAFGRGVSLSSIYGSAETGIWAIQPPTCHRDCYIVHPRIVHLEVLEPDEKGFGKVVVTNLVRTQFPVVRYDTGDVGRLEVVEGRPGLRLLGRRAQHNSFLLGSEYFTTDEIEQACPSFRRLHVLDYQLVLSVDPVRHVDKATFKIVPQIKIEAPDEEEIHREILQAIRGAEPPLPSEEVSSARGDGTSVQCIVAVHIVSDAELVRTATAAKTMRIVDMRK